MAVREQEWRRNGWRAGWKEKGVEEEEQTTTTMKRRRRRSRQSDDVKKRKPYQTIPAKKEQQS